MKLKKTTTHHLPLEIEALIPENERSQAINFIISECRAGEFHDYRGNKYMCPKITVVNLLSETKDERLFFLRKAIIDGDYDELPNEDDTAEVKKMFLAEGGTIEMWNKHFSTRIL